jgi:hypothetical protein
MTIASAAMRTMASPRQCTLGQHAEDGEPHQTFAVAATWRHDRRCVMTSGPGGVHLLSQRLA